MSFTQQEASTRMYERRVVHERLRIITDALPVGIAYVDQDRRCRFANARFAAAYGMTVDELLGKHADDFIRRDVLEIGDPFFEAAHRGRAVDFTHPIRHADGRMLTIRTFLRPDTRADGSVEGFYICSFNVTKQKEADERLRALTEHLPVGIAYIDQSKYYRFANARFAAAYGMSVDELLGKHADEFIWRDAMEIGDPFFESAHGGTPVDFIHPMRHSDGRLLTIRTYLRPDIGADGVIGGIYVCSFNVTRQHEADAALLQAQKMDAVGQLASGIAHDFNNLLAIVLGNMVPLRDEVADNAALQEYVEPAIRAADQGARLTAQLLAIARRQPLQPELIDVEACVGDFFKLLRRTIPPNIELNTGRRGEPIPVHLDRAQFETALLNLCLNARDAMPDGGRISIDIEYPDETFIEHADETAVAAPAGAGGDSAGPFVRLAVSDTGCGMSEQTAAQAFEPFFTTKGLGKGTGLGLAMVYGFIRQSRGSISLQSAPGKGTRFTLLLPVATDEQRETAAREAAAVTGHGLVLLVDDNHDLRHATRRQLAKAGYTVIEAASGEEAFDLLDSSLEDLRALVSDVVMPGMSGFRLARRAAFLRPSLRIVLMTGFDSTDMEDRVGVAVTVLRKPFRLQQLVSAIESAG
jgi:PAS domain S-box-containing protein